MARPVPLRDRRDRFRVVEEEHAPEDLSPSDPIEDDGALTQMGVIDPQPRPSADRQSPGAMDEASDPAAAMPSGMNDDAAALAHDPAELAAAQPAPMSDIPPVPAKQDGETSIISLVLMALIAAGLSAAVVLFLF